MRDFIACLPAALLAAGGVVILAADGARKPRSLTGPLVCLSVTIALAGVALAVGDEPSHIGRFIVSDELSWGASWLTLGFAVLTAAFAADGTSPRTARRFGLLLLSASGVVLAGSAGDLSIALIAIELAALPVAAAFLAESDTPTTRKWARGILALNAGSFGLLVLGAALLAGHAGSTNLMHLRGLAVPAVRALQRWKAASPASPGVELGEVCLLGGLGVHFLVAPFQLAVAEIFDGAKAWTLGLTVVFPRGAALLLMIRILVNALPRFSVAVQTSLIAVALVTILIGCSLALVEANLRRLLAFSTAIAGAVILAGLAAGCTEISNPNSSPWLHGQIPGGVGSACMCFVFDALALLGLLAILGSHSRSAPLGGNGENRAVSTKIKTAAACVLVMSLAGMPPFAGFWPRVGILRSLLSVTVEPQHGFLPHQNIGYVAFAMVTAAAIVVTAAVLLPLVGRAFCANTTSPSVADVTDQPDAAEPRSLPTFLLGAVAAIIVVLLGVWPAPALRLVARATRPVSSQSALSTKDQIAARRRFRHAIKQSLQADRWHIACIAALADPFGSRKYAQIARQKAWSVWRCFRAVSRRRPRWSPENHGSHPSLRAEFRCGQDHRNERKRIPDGSPRSREKRRTRSVEANSSGR